MIPSYFYFPRSSNTIKTVPYSPRPYRFVPSFFTGSNKSVPSKMQSYIEFSVLFPRLAINYSFNYVSAIVPLLTPALSATAVALHTYWKIIRHLVCPVVYVLASCYAFCIPFLAKLVQHAIISVLSQPRRLLIAEVFTLFALFSLFFVVRRLNRRLKLFVCLFQNGVNCLSLRYKAIRRHVSAKSKAVALVIPHAVYILAVCTMHFVVIGKYCFARNGLGTCLSTFAISNRAVRIVGIVLAAVMWPSMKSVQLIYSMKAGQNVKDKDDKRGKSKLEGHPFSTNDTARAWPFELISHFFICFASWTTVASETNGQQQQKENPRSKHGQLGLLLDKSAGFISTNCVELKMKLFQLVPKNVLSIFCSVLSIGHSILTTAAENLFQHRAGHEAMQTKASNTLYKNIVDRVADEMRKPISYYTSPNVENPQRDLDCAAGNTSEKEEKDDDNGGVANSNMQARASKYHVLFRLCYGNRYDCIQSSLENHSGNLGQFHHRRVAAELSKDSDTTISETSSTQAMASGNVQDSTVDSELHSSLLWSDETGKSYDALRTSAERELLRFWVVLAMIWTMRCSLHALCPSLKVFHRILLAVDVWLLYVIIWAQLGFTKGADILYEVLVHILYRKSFRLLPWLKVSSSSDTRNRSTGKMKNSEAIEHLGFLMLVAKSLKITETIRSRRVWRFLFDSGLAVGLFLLFTLTPRPFTFLASLFAGVVWPCMRSVVIAAVDYDDVDAHKDKMPSSPRASSGDCNNQNGNSGRSRRSSSASMQRRNWLAYWTAYAFVELAYIVLGATMSWVPLIVHVKVAAVVWFQVDDFAGAFYLLNWTMTHIGFVMSMFNRYPITSQPKKT